jgi:hypothetical protein
MASFEGSSWSEWGDSNSRPPAPEAGALPGCATLRLAEGDVYRQAPLVPQPNVAEGLRLPIWTSTPPGDISKGRRRTLRVKR